jgi:precorrin-8X/cobalt-precorrin-8 methylmutase
MLFDRYIAVDWSAANTPRLGKDSIWIAETGREAVNIATRAAAMDVITDRLRDARAVGQRVLIGFDFVFGYPRGAAAAIAGAPRWDALWSHIGDRIEDRDDNTSNRFEVAAEINRVLGDHHYWGHPHQHHYEHLGPKKPGHGYATIPERRIAEAYCKGPQPVWKLTGVGSVGSQSLLGIARLQQLRAQFADAAIWPFETDFDRALAPITVVEMYPSLFQITGTILPKDREQVETCVVRFAGLDREGRLGLLLSAPPAVAAQREVLITEEGWIAGVGHEHLLAQSEQAA